MVTIYDSYNTHVLDSANVHIDRKYVVFHVEIAGWNQANNIQPLAKLSKFTTPLLKYNQHFQADDMNAEYMIYKLNNQIIIRYIIENNLITNRYFI